MVSRTIVSLSLTTSSPSPPPLPPPLPPPMPPVRLRIVLNMLVALAVRYPISAFGCMPNSCGVSIGSFASMYLRG